MDELVEEIVMSEPIITEKQKPQLKALIRKLIDKIESKKNQQFELFKTLNTHA